MTLIAQARWTANALKKLSGEMERNGSPAALVFAVRNRANDLERAARQEPSELWLLKQIVAHLPTNRDWLDPAVEGEAREIIKRAAPEAEKEKHGED